MNPMKDIFYYTLEIDFLFFVNGLEHDSNFSQRSLVGRHLVRNNYYSLL